jgi:Mn-dependent DtxR family transcriptional regulator
MDEQQGQFLKAVYAVQNEIGRARVLDIARHLGLDIRTSKADRYLYHETTLELREGGYIDCLVCDEWVTCGIVRLTAEGLNYVEESKRRSQFT